MLNWLKNLFDFSQNKEEPDPMKYLIVGLGNMGAEYDNTRHNIGFEVVDALAKEFDIIFKNDSLGDLAEFKHKGRTFVLLKPSTYMNLSGKAVRAWMTKKKIEKENLLVIVDDMNIDLGLLRLRGKGSDGGHNGLKSIDQMTGGNNYARIRFGIGNDFSKGRQVDFVLGKWTSEEQNVLPEIIKRATDGVKKFGTIGLSHTMTELNKKAKKEEKK
jgi:PTH1 family peptidyl-tRNA hydrolase